MKSENLSTFGAIVASFLATSCCIGPAVFIIFGVSAGFMGEFVFLESFRPFLLGGGLLMLCFSFWKLFLKSPDCNCKEDLRIKKIAKFIWWFGFVAFISSISFPKIIIWIYDYGGVS